MPKIQLSALATDMKGKSGGSVFARNKGGLYFRNNPGAVQKKSNSWGYQKAKFTALSTSWRALTNEQRIAWEEAGVNYPAQDAWGNSYIPSGYQLYMRLNGTLSSYNFDLLSTPASPGTWPEDYDNIGSYSPNLPAFTPKMCASLRGTKQSNWYLLSKNYLDGVNMQGLTHLSMRFTRDIKERIAYSTSDIVRLFSLVDGDSFGSFAAVTFNKQARAKLVVVYNYSSDEVEFVSEVNIYDITKEWNSGQFHFTFYSDMNADESAARVFNKKDILAKPMQEEEVARSKADENGILQSRVYCNGLLLEADSILYYNNLQDPYNDSLIPSGDEINAPIAVASDNFSATLRVGNYTDGIIRVLNVSDIRFYDIEAMGLNGGCTSNEDCPDDYDCYQGECTLSYDRETKWNDVKYKLIYRGYLLGNETAVSPLNAFLSGEFQTISDKDYPGIVLTNDEDCCGSGSDCADFSDQECRDCCCIYVGDEPWPVQNIAYTFSPFVLITPIGLQGTNFGLAVCCTKPLSLGKSGNNQQYKLAGTIPPWVTPIKSGGKLLRAESRTLEVEPTSYDVSDAIKSIVASVPADTNLFLSYRIINIETGEQVECKPKRPPYPNPIRFKAGSELSSSVN